MAAGRWPLARPPGPWPRHARRGGGARARAGRAGRREPQETAAARAEAAPADLSDDRLDKPVFDAQGRRLPAGTQWALPPVIRLRAASAAPAQPAAALTTSVLRSRRFALSPAARRNVQGGRVAPAALALLLRLRGNGPPVLVHAARGADLSIQETTLQGTQATVSLLDALPAGAAPADLRLKSVRAGFADAGTGRVDAGDPGSTGRAAAEPRAAVPRHPVRLGRRDAGAGPRLLGARAVRVRQARHPAHALRGVPVPRGRPGGVAGPARRATSSSSTRRRTGRATSASTSATG